MLSLNLQFVSLRGGVKWHWEMLLNCSEKIVKSKNNGYFGIKILWILQ